MHRTDMARSSVNKSSYMDNNHNKTQRTEITKSIISNGEIRSGTGQGTSTASKATERPNMSSYGDHTTKTESRETSQTVERRLEQILNGHDLAEDRQDRLTWRTIMVIMMVVMMRMIIIIIMIMIITMAYDESQ